MAILDSPPERWYAAHIVGLADITDIAGLEPAELIEVQHKTRQAVAQLLPSALDFYLTTRVNGAYSSVRITGVKLGTMGMSMPGTPDGEMSMVVWVGRDGDEPTAYDGLILPPVLSSAIAAHAARRVLGTDWQVIELGEHGRIGWSPAAIRITRAADVPGPPRRPMTGAPPSPYDVIEFDYHADVVGNYTSSEPGYAVWLWFTDPRSGQAEATAYALTPDLDDEDQPPRPPYLAVEDLATLRAWTEPEPDEPAPAEAATS